MLFVRNVSISGYRSVRSAHAEMDRLNVFVGKNGAGKTNLYRALQLVQAAAAGNFAREIASEGGMESALWAGRRIKGQPARIALSVTLAPDARSKSSFTYEIEAGLAQAASVAAFPLEPQVKEERILFHDGRRSRKILERRGPYIVAIDDDGEEREMSTPLLASQTALGIFDEPGGFADIHLIRKTLSAWRFYHELRTDAASALRKPALAVTSPVLDADGGNLAAVFATLAHIRQDTHELDAAIEEAFPGSELVIPEPIRDASFQMTYPDFVLDGGSRRLFEAHELSDGTLRFLGLAGALLGYYNPPLIALNEPEASLHPQLLAPLARLIVKASANSQLWIVTHSNELAAAISTETGILAREVVKRNGETTIVD